MTPIDHARLSAIRWGGMKEEYLAIHEWMDQTKGHLADFRHRMWLHNSFGMLLAEQVFGPELEISTGYMIPVREITRFHITEDLGFVPTINDWIREVEFTQEGRRKFNCVPKEHLKRIQKIHDDERAIRSGSDDTG